MSAIGNIIWLIFGGLPAAIGYFLGGLGLCITIIGIPWGLMSFKLAGDILVPFGKQVTRRQRGTGCVSIVVSIVWIITVGWLLALTHLVLGLFFFITIIGIPFGQQHFKLIPLALDPFGYELR
jgi:uncharacterized membrane protein YccF (DUF307 family)